MTASKKNNTATPSNLRKTILSTVAVPTIALSLFWGQTSQATTVQFQTVMGDIEVNLFDETTPETVANFLAYVQNEDYNNSFFHRSIPGFVVQGGGFFWDEGVGATPITTLDPVINEPIYSNLRGTIAMAKQSGLPDSATSQWFFNLADSSGNLDSQNGGFTVFGQVVGDGMDVVDAIAALPTISTGDAVFSDLPVIDLESGAVADDSNLVIITSIQVLDAAADTAASLNPVLNTASPATPTPTSAPTDSSGGGGGGGANLLFLTLLSVFTFAPLRRKLLS